MRILAIFICMCVVQFGSTLSAQDLALVESSRAEAAIGSTGIRQMSAIVLFDVLGNDSVTAKLDGVRVLLGNFKSQPHVLSVDNVEMIFGCIRRGEVRPRDAARLLIAFLLDGCGTNIALLNEIKAELSLSKYTRILPNYTSVILGRLTDWELNQSSMNLVGFLNLNSEMRSMVLGAKTATLNIRARLGDVDAEKTVIRLFEWRMSRNDDYRLDLDVSAAGDLLIVNTANTREVFFEALRSDRMRTVLMSDASGLMSYAGDMSIAYEMLISLSAMYPNSGFIPVTEEERAGLDNSDNMKAYKQRVEKAVFELEHEVVGVKMGKLFVPRPEILHDSNDVEIIEKP